MDDDPEPSLDQVILGSRETNEQAVNIRELQKSSLENSEETGINQESGDNGPFLEQQDTTKKAISGKDAPDQTLQTDSNASLLKRKERVDPSQASDLSGSLKSSATSLRKPSRRSIQRLAGQETRRSSQQSVVSQLPPLSQKPSRTQSINEADAKDITWVSKRTGKIMKCRSQQTSLIWERKVLSEILHPSSEGSDKNKEETNTEEDFTSSGETAAPEETPGQELRHSIPQREGKGSKRSSQQLQESRRSSQRSQTEPPLLLQRGMGVEEEEDVTWISPKTGKEMKNKTQQTSVIWELKTLSEILRSSSQESLYNAVETDTTEVEDAVISSGDTEVEQRAVQESRPSIKQPENQPAAPTGQESRRSSQQREAKTPRRGTQQLEEQKTEPHGERQTDTFDQAQQTDSAENLRKELLDCSQQTEVSRGSKTSSEVKLCDSRRGSQRADFQRSSRGSLGPGSKMGVENVPEAPTGLESKQTEPTQEPFITREVQGRRGTVLLEENTWISRKTGKVVKSQGQQTDKSWLQYCAEKMKKVKKCSSQQTDESFLQCYLASKMKRGSHETLSRQGAQQQESIPDRLCSVCDDGVSRDLKFSELDLSSLSSNSAIVEMAKEHEPPIFEENEGAEREQPADDKVVDHQPTRSEAPRTDASESQSTLGSVSSYVEGEDAAQQTYSIISTEDGIWMNRRTGKLLVSHRQQTSQISIKGALSATALRRVSDAEEAPKPLGSGMAPGASVDEEQVEREEAQPETEADGQQPPRTASRRDSQQYPEGDAHLIVVQPLGDESQSADDVEQLLSSRLSEAMLLSAESPDAEDENTPVYTASDEGNWVNVQTGRVLASQSQQTEEGFDKLLAEDEQPPGDTLQQPPEEGQAKIQESSSDHMQQPGGEGMDDDPVTKAQQEPPAAGNEVLLDS